MRILERRQSRLRMKKPPLRKTKKWKKLLKINHQRLRKRPKRSFLKILCSEDLDQLI
jgi:hypothetical protein